MAKQLQINAQIRLETGRSAVKKIKQQGRVPAVVYGGHDKPISLSLNAREIGNLLAHATSEHVLVDLEIQDGDAKTKRLALIQEVQHDPIKRNVLHVDFHAVRADEMLHSQIPIEAFGEADGVKNFGGLLELNMHSIEIECLPKDLPEIIRLDVSALGIGDAIHIKDIQLPAGVTARGDGDLTVIRVAAPKVESEPEPAAAGAQPEVLKEKKDDAAKPAAGAKPAADAKPAAKK
ncbi:MAG: 50S ribosomal protein L25/general stress protein Ctc [Chthoniobacter sp.]|nr:50S ribosomal protein L25/general stress protein Ctc [Chthoniobacter sp.]